ncbi:MAG: winged helix-turn-helix transcriptional regulator [Thermoplasmata archaeon]|nr:winged helix-turn-helix transcriptional regulator [Thermoplasmata archaeon]
MDAHDVRIFCALAVSGPPEAIPPSRPPGLRRIARSLGLDEKTVRLRLRRLEEEGFIKYYQAAPDLALLGMSEEVTCRFEAVNVPTKLAALHFAQEQEGMVEALDFLGGGFVVTAAGADLDQALDLHRRIAHRFELDRYEQGRRRLTPVDARLLPLDWKIIERMRYDARAPITEVAGAIGVTTRMVRYRLGRIRASGSVTIRPMIDAGRQRGVVLYRLVITTPTAAREEVLARLRRRMGASIWAVRVSLAGPLLVDMFGASLAEPEESLVQVLEVPEVQACAALTLKEILEPPHENWVDRRIADLAAGRVGSPSASDAG